MIVVLYVPICVFRVRYEVASGRPFTELEQVVLKALAEKNVRVRDLAARFCLRDAIVIESIVTLAREGWVALNAEDGTYFITQTGRQAIADSAIPQFLVVDERQTTVLMERITGGLIGGSEIIYQRNNHADFPGGLGPPTEQRLDVEWWNTRLVGGQIEPFLKTEEQRWVRRVDIPQLAGIDAYWVKATVDTISGKVSFERPISWESTLREALHRKAEQVSGEKIGNNADVTLASASVAYWHEVSFKTSDLWIDRDLHAAALRAALEKAVTYVHVASAFFDPSVLNGITREAILAALSRGVKVGLLWGYEQGERAKQTIEWLDKLAYDAKPHQHRLCYNRIASDSHAKILTWDEPEGPRVVVGSCNWLSNPLTVNDQTRTNISICVRDASAMAEVLRAFAGLWLQTGRQDWCPAAEDLFRYAAALSSQIAVAERSETGPLNGRLRMVCDSDHEREMRDLFLRARSRCWIASHKMGSNAGPRLASLSHPGRPANLEPLVTYEQASDETTPVEDLSEQVREAGGKLTQRDHFHAKCIVADDVAFVSSFNFLSASPFGSGRTAREVGLMIENKEIADLLWVEASRG